jgi:hypothetical protein
MTTLADRINRDAEVVVTNVDLDLSRKLGINAWLLAEYRTGARNAAPWLKRRI